MAGPNELMDKGFMPTTAIPLFYGVKLTGTESVGVADTAGEFVIGFSQDERSAEDVGRYPVNVRPMGITRAVAAAPLTQGARVQIAGDGRVMVGVGGNAQVGIVLTTVTEAGDHIDLLLTPGSTVPA